MSIFKQYKLVIVTCNQILQHRANVLEQPSPNDYRLWLATVMSDPLRKLRYRAKAAFPLMPYWHSKPPVMVTATPAVCGFSFVWGWQNHQMRCLTFLFTLLFGLTCYAGTIDGCVVSVADGDTVTVLDSDKVQHKIRLSGIDAPEKAQAFGNRSKESLSDLVFSKAVTVVTEKKDRYGRDVGKVLINGVDANLEQVQRGFAWHYKAYEREQSANDRKLYDLAENEARAAKRGLWRDPAPIAPWDWRKVRLPDGFILNSKK